MRDLLELCDRPAAKLAVGLFSSSESLPVAPSWRMIRAVRSFLGISPFSVRNRQRRIKGRAMIRKRLAALAAVAGLGLLSGCANNSTACNSGCGLFSRLCGRTRTTTIEAMPVIESSGLGCCEGPVLMDRGPIVMPSAPLDFPGMPASPCAPAVPPGFAPGAAPLAPVPRIVPEPQAQARPYVP